MAAFRIEDAINKKMVGPGVKPASIDKAAPSLLMIDLNDRVS